LILWRIKLMVHSKIHLRSAPTHKVINYTHNGTMIQIDYYILTFWLLCFECITMTTLVLKTNLGFFNRLIFQTCHVGKILAKVMWNNISTLPTPNLCKDGDIQHWTNSLNLGSLRWTPHNNNKAPRICLIKMSHTK
jgi:hypothetical protein